MSAVHDVRAIWRVATGERDGRAGFVAGKDVLPLIAAITGVFVFAFAQRPIGPALAPRVVLGAAAFWLALVWVVQFLPASLAMHSAANARLVPRQRRRLMEMAAAGWALASGGFGLAVADWGTGLLAGFLMLAYAASCFAGPLAACAAIVAGNALWLVPAFLPGDVAGTLSTPAGMTVQTLALLAAGAWALVRLYPDGGDTHIAQRAHQMDFLSVFGKERSSAVDVIAPRSAWSNWVYPAALRRDCRRADPGRMLQHALGPVVHWSTWITGILTFVGIGIAARIALSFVDGDGARALLTGLPALALLALPLVLALGTAMYGPLLRRRAGEQALLRLTPLAGSAALLNRRLGGQLLRHVLLYGAVMTAAILLTTRIIGMDDAVLLRQLALCCVAVQVSLVGLLGDYAGKGPWQPPAVLLAVCTALAEGGAAYALGEWNGSPWYWLIALALVVAPFQVWRGWRRMVAAPAAFPAGRLA